MCPYPSLNFQPNEPFRTFYDNKWPSRNFYQIHFRKIQGVWRGEYPPFDHWMLKRALGVLITNLMSPLQCLYDYPFYNPCPEGSGWERRGVILKDIISGPFNYVEQHGYLKFWLNVFGQIVGVGGGLVALELLSTIKKDKSPCNF